MRTLLSLILMYNIYLDFFLIYEVVKSVKFCIVEEVAINVTQNYLTVSATNLDHESKR